MLARERIERSVNFISILIESGAMSRRIIVARYQPSRIQAVKTDDGGDDLDHRARRLAFERGMQLRFGNTKPYGGIRGVASFGHPDEASNAIAYPLQV
jgi:hypothetical protein